MPVLGKYGLRIGVWAATDPKSAACMLLPESDPAIKFSASASVGQTCPIHTSTIPVPAVTVPTAMKLGIGIIHEPLPYQDFDYLSGDLRITVLADGVEIDSQYILEKDQGHGVSRTFSRLQISPTKYQQFFIHCVPHGELHVDRASPPNSRRIFDRPVNSGIKFTEAAFENSTLISSVNKNGTAGNHTFRDLWPLPPLPLPEGHSMIEVIVTAGIARPGQGYHPPRSIGSISLDPKKWMESVEAEIKKSQQQQMGDGNKIPLKPEIIDIESDDSVGNRETPQQLGNTGENMQQGILPTQDPPMPIYRPLIIHPKVFEAQGPPPKLEPDMEFWGRLHVCRAWIYIVPPVELAEPTPPVSAYPRPQLILKFRVPAAKLKEIISRPPRAMDEGYGTSSISPEVKKSKILRSSQFPSLAEERPPANRKVTKPVARYSSDTDTTSSRHSTPSRNVAKPKAKSTPKKRLRQTPQLRDVGQPAAAVGRIQKKAQQKKLEEGLVLAEIRKGTNFITGQVRVVKDSSASPRHTGSASPGRMQEMGMNGVGGQMNGVKNLASSPSAGTMELPGKEKK
ncbi:Protein of unknown function [Pyronema omphalodes CBS 100304]|uniref:Uncharacterized protein n=1 Tax=Pyronema omphalodes (strain CBS 100304) TaxID=1076935 RepID=U4L670_PYROM|nr:Protein of unknown function [Pyronema omphalodes CBS 100304]